MGTGNNENQEIAILMFIVSVFIFLRTGSKRLQNQKKVEYYDIKDGDTLFLMEISSLPFVFEDFILNEPKNVIPSCKCESTSRCQ